MENSDILDNKEQKRDWRQEKAKLFSVNRDWFVSAIDDLSEDYLNFIYLNSLEVLDLIYQNKVLYTLDKVDWNFDSLFFHIKELCYFDYHPGTEWDKFYWKYYAWCGDDVFLDLNELLIVVWDLDRSNEFRFPLLNFQNLKIEFKIEKQKYLEESRLQNQSVKFDVSKLTPRGRASRWKDDMFCRIRDVGFDDVLDGGFDLDEWLMKCGFDKGCNFKLFICDVIDWCNWLDKSENDLFQLIKLYQVAYKERLLKEEEEEFKKWAQIDQPEEKEELSEVGEDKKNVVLRKKGKKKKDKNKKEEDKKEEDKKEEIYFERKIKISEGEILEFDRVIFFFNFLYQFPQLLYIFQRSVLFRSCFLDIYMFEIMEDFTVDEYLLLEN